MDCPVCDTKSALSYKHPEADIYRCGECGHCFSDPRSVNVPIAYDATYYEGTQKNWFENPNFMLFEKIAEAIRLKGENMEVIDIGCGRGDLLRFLKGKLAGAGLTGLDLFENLKEPGIRFLAGDFISYSFTQKYGAVLSIASIEHVGDVKAFVRKLAEVCADDGILIVMTVEEKSPLYAVARFLRLLGFQGPFNRLYSAHHLHHFTSKSLERLLSQNGFVVKKRFWHNVPMAAVDFTASSRVQSGVYKLGLSAIFLIDRLAGTGYLQTVVCEKAS